MAYTVIVVRLKPVILLLACPVPFFPFLLHRLAPRRRGQACGKLEAAVVRPPLFITGFSSEIGTKLRDLGRWAGWGQLLLSGSIVLK